MKNKTNNTEKNRFSRAAILIWRLFKTLGEAVRQRVLMLWLFHFTPKNKPLTRS